MRTRLETLDDPRLDDYRFLKTRKSKPWSNRFVAEGRFVVERLLASSLRIHSLAVVENQWERLSSRVPGEVPVFLLSQERVSELVGFRFHQGVLACAERPAPPELAKSLAEAPSRSTWVACSRVTDPVNLATIIRLCTAFGASGLFLEPGCADPYSRRSVRVSMGNVFRLPIWELPDLQSELSRLRSEHGHTLFATVLADDAEPLDRVQPGERNVLVFGNEGEGLDRHWVELCDRQITISMRGETDSLNVAVAAGIFLYHFDPNR